jgi:hypothetical protein
MRKMKKALISSVVAMFLVALFSGIALAAEKVTIEGIISESSQIITDQDEAYDIGDTEKGEELLDMVGTKVKVTGTVEEQDGIKTIHVAAFEVIEE